MKYSEFQYKFDLSAPINVNIEVTNKCNLQCLFCSANAENQSDPNELTIDDLMNLADELKEIKVFKVKVTGGEPFLKKGIMSFLKKLSPYHRIAINSNGTMINEEIAKELSTLNIDQVIISLDAGDPELNDRLRGRGSFKKIIAGINSLKKYKIPVNISSVLTKLNINNIRELARVVKELGFSSFGINHLHPQGRATKIYNELSLSHDELRTFTTFLEDFNKDNEDFSISLEQSHWFKMENRYENWKAKAIKNNSKKLLPCHAGVNQIGILANGDVVPCLLLADQRAGNIKNDKISNIWKYSPILKKMKELAKTEIASLEGCAECKYKPVCAGGCRAKAYLNSKNLLGIDPTCPYSNNNTNYYIG